MSTQNRIRRSFSSSMEVAGLLGRDGHIVLPALDGHGDSSEPFTSIEDNGDLSINHPERYVRVLKDWRNKND